MHVHTSRRVGLPLAPGVALYFTACSCTFVAVLLEQALSWKAQTAHGPILDPPHSSSPPSTTMTTTALPIDPEP